MSAYTESGARITEAAFPATAYTDPDPIMVVSQNVYKGVDFDISDQKESQHVLAFRAGQHVRQSQIAALFPQASIASISPATGPAAGGQVLTIKGAGLVGVSGVTFGGTAGTAFSVVDERTIKVTTPAHATGAVTVVVQDDGGDVSKASGYTYV